MKTYVEAFTDLEALMSTRAEAYASGHANNDFCALPEEWRFFNGSSRPCDAAVGPCSCGAWHDQADTRERAKDLGSNQTPDRFVVDKQSLPLVLEPDQSDMIRPLLDQLERLLDQLEGVAKILRTAAADTTLGSRDSRLILGILSLDVEILKMRLKIIIDKQAGGL